MSLDARGGGGGVGGGGGWGGGGGGCGFRCLDEVYLVVYNYITQTIRSIVRLKIQIGAESRMSITI